MKLRDKCWVLGRNSGVIESNFADCTRGDFPAQDFFATEAEAWAAEAVRAGKEAERHEQDAVSLRKREAEAIAKSGADPRRKERT